MQNYILLLALALAAITPLPAYAGQTAGKPPLTLAAALARAEQANPDIAAAVHEVSAQQALWQQAAARPNPELAINVEDTQKANRSSSLQINQLIEMGGKRAARVAVGQQSHTAARLELAARRADVLAQVELHFHELWQAQEKQNLVNSSLELAVAVTTATSRRVALGKLSPMEISKARISESGLRMELAQARAEVQNARQKLAALWGSDSLENDFSDLPASPAPGLPSLPSMAELQARLQQSPAWLRSRLEVDKRLAMTQVERAKQAPDLSIGLGIKRDEQLGRNQAIFALTVALPFFDKNQGNLQEALSRRDKASDEWQATSKRLQTELQLAWQQLEAASEELALIRAEILPAAQTAYEGSLKGFEFGKFSFLDVQDAQRTLYQARAQHLRTQAETYRLNVEIRRLTASSDLQASNVSVSVANSAATAY